MTAATRTNAANGAARAGAVAAVTRLREKTRIPVNGLDQGMFIDSDDRTNPVLLFVHGGPGMPEHWLTRRYPTRLEERFTVAWWEQRGSGLSFRPGIPMATMTIEQFVADTLVAADYLRDRFGVERVILVGHSWGSYVAIRAAAASPERFSAYVGVSQVTHQVRSEELSHAYLLDGFRALGDRRMVRRLESATPPFSVPLPRAYDGLRDEAMHRLGVGTTRDMRSVLRGIFLPSLFARDYTLRERVNLWRGKRFSRRSGLWDAMQAADIADRIGELAVPAYFLHGIHDYTVSYPLARAFAAGLRAPVVAFYTFENSAHSPVLEEPDRALAILAEDVLHGTASLSDPDVAAPTARVS